MLIGDVVPFTDVFGEVVQLDFEVATGHILANRFPVADSARLLTSAAWEFAIEEWSRRLLLAKQGLTASICSEPSIKWQLPIRVPVPFGSLSG